MPVNTSIYQTQLPVQTPDVGAMAQRALTLSNMGMQNQQAQYELQKQQALRNAYSGNVDPNGGGINYQGVISQLGQSGYGDAAMQVQQQQYQRQKAQAEAQQQQAAAVNAADEVARPKLEYLMSDKVPDDQKPALYQRIKQELADANMPTAKMPEQYDKGWVGQTLGQIQNNKASLDAGLVGAKTTEANANAAAMPSKIAAQQFGRSSPNVALSSQYTQDVKPIRNSQIYMQQMLDSYKNKTPQGDAALVLNNFKIRSPQVADVNSIDEMKSSQAVSDVWKNKLNQALSGGFDQQTRDNLIRDGISAYRANMTSLSGIQKRYQARQIAQGVNDPTLTYEPASEDTNKEAMDLQQKIGGYVPPAQRPGLLGSIANMVGVGGPKNASAAQPQIKHGTIEDGYVFMGGDPGNPKSWMRQK